MDGLSCRPPSCVTAELDSVSPDDTLVAKTAFGKQILWDAGVMPGKSNARAFSASNVRTSAINRNFGTTARAPAAENGRGARKQVSPSASRKPRSFAERKATISIIAGRSVAHSSSSGQGMNSSSNVR